MRKSPSPRSDPAQSDGHNRRFGRDGEDLAAAWYKANGYRIIERNWRCRDGEVDLIAAAPAEDVLVVAEVKARTTLAFGSPAEAVTRTKQLRIRRLASQYLRDEPSPRWRAVRFDVVCVLGSEVTVIEGAF